MDDLLCLYDALESECVARDWLYVPLLCLGVLLVDVGKKHGVVDFVPRGIILAQKVGLRDDEHLHAVVRLGHGLSGEDCSVVEVALGEHVVERLAYKDVSEVKVLVVHNF